MKMIRILLTTAVAVFVASSCFAPLLDKPEGAEFHGELSQSELAKHQSSGGMVNSQGSAAPTLEPSHKSNGSDEKAANVLSQVESASAASRSLDQAGKDVKEADSNKGAKGFVFGGLFLLLGLGVAFGIREYLNRVVPEQPGQPSRRV